MHVFLTKREAMQSTLQNAQCIRLRKVLCLMKNVKMGNKFSCLRHYTCVHLTLLS